MARRLAILGAGGHAKMVIEAARSQGHYEPAVCLAESIEHTHVLGVPIDIESDELLSQLRDEGYWTIVAVGSNRLRARLTDKLLRMQFELATIISDRAWISPSAQIGAGSVLMPGAIIGACVTIGQGAIINTAASVDHDCQIGDFVHIAPGCHLAGCVSIGDSSFLGVGVNVIPEKTIGSHSIIGAGAVVVRDVPHHQTWVGCPARYLKHVG